MNYFEFFGLPVSFRVDEPALRRIFLENSKKFHPDFHTLANESEQARMLELSTLNNEAFKTLSDPDRRIQYVLKINGILGEEGKQTPLPQEFLMEMMDINESLMELEFDPDAGRYMQTLKSVENFENALYEDVRPVLESWTEADGPEPLRAVRDYFLKKRYLLRIRENLSTFASRLGD
ncbi:MAG: Fe-S protein assembly co-chaperone HscB [Haliscomenobacteraceae bacterium CHB4]|nr:Co-chaperone protein HscB [Saprospiraceae bacterium]MCE7926268.1 Fe-S protein assembly co-chaperone HscB [Haliscomenobacteraceae bacterium CHB4]